MEKFRPFPTKLCIPGLLSYIIKISTHMGCSREVRVSSIFIFDADVGKYSYICLLKDCNPLSGYIYYNYKDFVA